MSRGAGQCPTCTPGWLASWPMCLHFSGPTWIPGSQGALPLSGARGAPSPGGVEGPVHGAGGSAGPSGKLLCSLQMGLRAAAASRRPQARSAPDRAARVPRASGVFRPSSAPSRPGFTGVAFCSPSAQRLFGAEIRGQGTSSEQAHGTAVPSEGAERGAAGPGAGPAWVSPGRCTPQARWAHDGGIASATGLV